MVLVLAAWGLLNRTRGERAFRNSIAVLPFFDVTNDPVQQAFADGLAAELISRLGKSPALRMIARNSSCQFPSKANDLGNIRRRLGVGWILEGSVQADEDRLRVTAELILPRTARRPGRTYMTEPEVTDSRSKMTLLALLARCLGSGWRVRACPRTPILLPPALMLTNCT